MTKTLRTVRLLALVTTVALGAVAPLLVAVDAAAGPRGCAAGTITAGPKGWTRIAAPRFEGSATLVAYAVRPTAPAELYATNGTQVMRSGDAGCTWRAAFAMPAAPTAQLPLVSAAGRITSVAAPAGTRDVYLVVTTGPRLDVVRSADGGTTWAASLAGLVQHDATADNAELLVAGGAEPVLHLVTGGATVAGSTGRLVFTSNDRGASWAPSQITATLSNAQTTAAPRLHDLAIDPRDANVLFAATSVGLFRSADRGEKWQNAGIGGGSAITTVVAGRGRSGVTLMAFDDANHVGYVSGDGGAAWGAVTMPAATESAATDPRQGSGIVAAGSSVYQVGFVPATLTEIWSGAPRLTRVGMDSTAAPFVYACSCGPDAPAIWRRLNPPLPGGLSFAPPPPPVPLPGALPSGFSCQGEYPKVGTPTAWAPSALTPATSAVRLAPGQSVTMPYRLHAAPRPLDVYFLTSSGSYLEYALCAFHTGAVLTANAVQRVRNLRVGVGDYRDFPGESDEWGTGQQWADGEEVTKASYVYQRRNIVALPDESLVSALRRIRWSLSPDRAGADALHQAVTGLGKDLLPVGASLGDIAGGQHAAFGPSSYKVVLSVVGTWYNDASRKPGYPGVSLDTALSALKSHDVHNIGVWINNAGNKMAQVRRERDGRLDVLRFAAGTGQVAHRPVDCNADGYLDLERGEPLVCDWVYADAETGYTELGDTTMGVTMSRLLLELRDLQRVRLVATQGEAALQAVDPPAYDNVDLLQRSDHDFQVTFRCGPKQTNQLVPITLAGVAGDATIATSTVSLQCGAPVPPRQRPAAIVAPPVPPVPPVPNPLPNPGPNPGANPAPNPAPNPAQAPQAQAQPVTHGVTVAQRQAEPQLAFQRALNDLQGNEAMSALRPEARDPLGAAKRVALIGGMCLVAATAAMQSAYGLARERRRR